MSQLRVVVGDMVADFELDLDQSREAAAVEQLGLEAAPNGFSMSIVVAVAASARTLQRSVFGDQFFEPGRLQNNY